MKSLAVLRSRLRRAILAEAARRFLAWLSCALILISAGMAAAAAFRSGPAALSGLALVALSALPPFLFWPPRPRLLERALRRLDADSVIEAYLEAPPGAARELLRARAERRSAELAGLPAPRERIPRRLAALMIAAALVFAAGEAGSRILRKRPLLAQSAEEAPTERGEKASFDTPGEERFLEGEKRAEEESEGAAGPGGIESGSEGDGLEGSGEDLLASSRRRGSEEDTLELTEHDVGGESSASRETDRVRREVQQGEGAPLASAEEGRGAGLEQGGRSPDGRGKGYESSGATGVPSPIVDYRARFFEVFAKRMGKRAAASGELELGALAELQRRYFRSFSLSIESKPSEDPYESLLKGRWREARGGLE